MGHTWPFLLVCGPCVAILNYLGHVLYVGRAPRTKETLPDFREWCRVTRNPRVFRGLTGCQRTPRFWGITVRTNSDEKSKTRLLRQLLNCHDKVQLSLKDKAELIVATT